jgi:hypothetical protein
MGFALIAVLIIVAAYVFVVMGIFFIFAAILVGLVAILNDHRKDYFGNQPFGIFRIVAYVFAVTIMIRTTLCFTPRIERVFPTMWSLPDPFPSDYWFLFLLGLLFLLWSLKPVDPQAKPLHFTGAVLAEQLQILASAPFAIINSIKRSFTTLATAHWVTGIGGLLLLLLSVPVGVITYTSGTLAVLWFAIFWAAFSLLLLGPMRLVFYAMHRSGHLKVCSGCGREHRMTGPGPLGMFRITCLCGQKMNIWTNSGSAACQPVTEKPSWSERPYQPGTRPLMALGTLVMVCMLLRTLGVWGGPIKKIPWAKDVEMENLTNQPLVLHSKTMRPSTDSGEKKNPPQHH